MSALLKSLLPPVLKPGFWGTRYLDGLRNDAQFKSGIFKGMHYVNESICGSILPKYLGVYELELVPVFERLFQLNIGKIIDVGAAEGYYAVGLALRFPGSPVIAYEATDEGRELLRQVVARNGVERQVRIRGLCDAPLLKAETAACDPNVVHLLVMDVEGAEEELLRLHDPHDLRNFHIVMELHDWVDPAMGDRLRDKFSSTHTATLLQARRRTFADLSIPHGPLTRLCLAPSLLSFSHERRLPMRWLVLEPKAS
ncbi:MAG: hypothetical protein VKP70_12060 [Cyanobacteriota bacterium]|nr:hypothetical protein [Cyanobacteriota bacterium]